MNLTEPNISIIILNWNGWEDTIECIESVFQINYTNFKVIIIDNGSDDDSIEQIEKYCKGEIKIESKFFNYNTLNKPITIKKYLTKPIIDETEQFKIKEIILLKNEINSGFTEGNNVGIKFSMDFLDPDYILLLNNDTVIPKNILNELVKSAQENESTLIQPKIIDYDNLALYSTGHLLDLFGFPQIRGNGDLDMFQYDYEVKNDFFYASGACILIKSDFLLNFEDEYFDRELFAYYEDVDISWFARLLDYKISYYPQSICYHKGSKSSGGFNLKTGYWGWRNRIRVMIKNYSLINLFIAVPIAIILEFLMSLVASIHRKDPRYTLMFFKALLWNIIQLESTIKLRKLVQKNRVVKDSEIRNHMVNHSLELAYLKEEILKILSR